MSRPSRARGLKLDDAHNFSKHDEVAPFAGAWIETSTVANTAAWSTVAPFAGAWIENRRTLFVALRTSVAPFAGAWIETSITSQAAAAQAMSRPSRARGLKLLVVPVKIVGIERVDWHL